MGEPGPSHLSSESRLDQVLADYSRRRAAGESIALDDLLSRHPQLADALRSHFAADEAAGQTPLPAESDTATSVPQTDHGTEYRPRSSQTTIPPRAITPVRSCSLPEEFGRYRVGRCLGQGSMGAVYLADDTQLERPVALKIPKFADDDDDAEMTARFYREARAAAMLRHANLCPVYDVGEIDGVRYLSMAYIEGRPLSEVLADGGPLDGRDAATFVLKLARALEAAHARGVIHRDLKPANIMIDGHQEPIIMDFGLARQTNKEDSRLTQEGMLMGSPAYMSPEQVEGDMERMGPGCDIYSLGIILYELLTGEVPFKGSIASVMGQIIGTAPRKPSTVKRGIDPALEAICLKMIAKRLEDRFATMTDVVRALDAYAAGRPTGVALPASERTATMPGLDALPPSRGIVIAPWMLATAVLIVIAGFGITWGLITTMMKQQAGADEVKVSAQTSKAIDQGQAKITIGDKEVSHDELKQPIPLKEGNNELSVTEGDASTKTKIGTLVVPKGDDQPHFAVYENDQFIRKRLHRVVAEWVLLHGGKVVLKDGTTFEKFEDLPEGTKIELAEIQLPKETPLPASTFELLLQVRSLKRLVVAKSVLTLKERETLKTALPDVSIESAPSKSG
jgi:serine/threonine protein kinase